jgi:hypothetical protein
VLVPFTDPFPLLIVLKARRAVVQNPQLVISTAFHDRYRPQIELQVSLGREDDVSIPLLPSVLSFHSTSPSLFDQIVPLMAFAGYSTFFHSYGLENFLHVPRIWVDWTGHTVLPSVQASSLYARLLGPVANLKVSKNVDYLVEFPADRFFCLFLCIASTLSNPNLVPLCSRHF